MLRAGRPGLRTSRIGDCGFPDDCFIYELAREKWEPVLWKGDDFVHTDLRAAMQQP
jgi:hypothetical protein